MIKAVLQHLVGVGGVGSCSRLSEDREARGEDLGRGAALWQGKSAFDKMEYFWTNVFLRPVLTFRNIWTPLTIVYFRHLLSSSGILGSTFIKKRLLYHPLFNRAFSSRHYPRCLARATFTCSSQAASFTSSSFSVLISFSRLISELLPSLPTKKILFLLLRFYCAVLFTLAKLITPELRANISCYIHALLYWWRLMMSKSSPPSVGFWSLYQIWYNEQACVKSTNLFKYSKQLSEYSKEAR